MLGESLLKIFFLVGLLMFGLNFLLPHKRQEDRMGLPDAANSFRLSIIGFVMAWFAVMVYVL